MLQKAILSSIRHGLGLKAGILNAADGNCPFDSIINNVKSRKCYKTKITESSKELRIRSINKAQQEVESISCIIADTTLAEWNKLKEHGIYETELADIAIIAVARAIHKDILVFNTNVQQSI